MAKNLMNEPYARAGPEQPGELEVCAAPAPLQRLQPRYPFHLLDPLQQLSGGSHCEREAGSFGDRGRGVGGGAVEERRWAQVGAEVAGTSVGAEEQGQPAPGEAPDGVRGKREKLSQARQAAALTNLSLSGLETCSPAASVTHLKN